MPLNILNPESFPSKYRQPFEDVAKKYFPQWNLENDWTIGCHGDRPHKPQRNAMLYLLDEPNKKYFFFDPKSEGSCHMEFKVLLFNENLIARYHRPRTRLLFIHLLCHSTDNTNEEQHLKCWQDEMSNRVTTAGKLGEKTLEQMIRVERQHYAAICKGHTREAERTRSILDQCETLEEGQNVPGWKIKL